ncbi:bifunctional oligoribonuclease/PAP phosphatase NrnA [bacterium]|nr:MAG: bifunctional oligoribonuclease/PAP phosphatase NrnA [bacterium]
MTISPSLKQDFQKAREFIDGFSHLFLVSHEHTDGDDLGAILALARALEKLGKKVSIAAKGGVPDNLLFLPGHGEVKDAIAAEDMQAGALVTLGCGNLARAGFEELEKWQKPVLNIDHHHDTKMFGTVNVWDETASANCELVFLMLKDWQVTLDKYMAQCLLTGVFTDTGGFRHANVSAQTLEVAAELLRKGARLDIVSRFTFSHKDLSTLRAWAVAFENARFDEERKIVYTVITEDELAKVGASEKDLEGVVELLNTIPEAKFSMLLKQRGDEVKGSLRSETYKGVDVSEIARAFGGGGHKLAAGFNFKGKIERTPEGWKII